VALVFDWLLLRLSARPKVRALAIPLLRAYLKGFPIRRGKAAIWSRVVNPYFAWHSHRFVATTRFGVRMAGDTRDLIQQYIYYFGMWEPDLTAYLRRLLKTGDTFIDVGANIGYDSLLAAKAVGSTGRIVAIEAAPETFEALLANVDRNHARNVRAVCVAASDSRGRLRLFGGRDFNVGETSVRAESGLPYSGYVRAAPLAEILDAEEVATAAVIKIDVEGAEWQVVVGMEPLLDQMPERVQVILEVEPDVIGRQGRTVGDFIDLFAKHGFRAYQMPVNYWAESYLHQVDPAPPRLIRGPIDGATHLVFSRAGDGSL
jgi:FkbM family methyltransferase